jgi:hypothetical protein
MAYNNYTHNIDPYKGTMRHTSSMYDVKTDEQIAKAEEAKQIATDSMMKIMAEMRARNAAKATTPVKPVAKKVTKPAKTFMFK